MKNVEEVCISHCPGDWHKLNTPDTEEPKESLKKEFNDDLNVAAELNNVIKANRARKSAN